MVDEVKKKPEGLSLTVGLSNGEVKDYTFGEANALGFTPQNVTPDMPQKYYYKDKYGNEQYTEDVANLPMSITLNENTGNIKISAPKAIYESEMFKQVFNPDELKKYSQAYKLNPDYKLSIQEKNKETGEMEDKEVTIPEYIERLNSSVEEYRKELLKLHQYRDALVKEYGNNAKKLSDDQIHMAMNYNGKAVYLPDSIFTVGSFGNGNKNVFAQLKDKRDENGMISVEELQKAYNMDNFGRDEMAALIAHINGTLSGSLGSEKWNSDDTYEDEEGNVEDNPYSTDEVAKLLNFKNYVLSNNPHSEWYQQVGASIESATYNFAYGALRVFSNLANMGEAIVTANSGKAVDNFIRETDDAMEYFNTYNTEIWDGVANAQIIGYLAGTLYASRLVGQAAGFVTTKTVGSVAKVAQGLTNKIGGTAAAALGYTAESAEATASSLNTIVSTVNNLRKLAMHSDEVALGTKVMLASLTVAQKTALATNMAISAISKVKEANVLTEFLFDTIHDAMLYDSTTLREVMGALAKDPNDPNKAAALRYWGDQLVDNAKYWLPISMFRATKALSTNTLGKTTLGQAMNIRLTKTISKLRAAVGDKLKRDWANGALITKLQEQLRTAQNTGATKKAERLAQKLDTLANKRLLNIAFKDLGDMKLDWDGLKLTDESAEAYKRAVNRIKGYEVAIDARLRAVDTQVNQMVGLVKDPSTGKVTYINPTLGGASAVSSQAYYKLADLARKYGLKATSDTLWSREMVNYFMGSYHGDVMKAISEAGGEHAAEAKKALSRIEQNVANAKSALPDEVVEQLDALRTAKLFQKYYAAQNEYGIAHGLLEKSKFESYAQNPIWMENGYMPTIIKKDLNGRWVDEEGRVGNIIEQEMKEFTYKAEIDQDYLDPELVKLTRQRTMAAAQVNKDFWDTYSAPGSSATNIVKISGEESEYARVLTEDTKNLKDQVVRQMNKTFTEGTFTIPKLAKNAPRFKKKEISEETMDKITASLSPAETSTYLIEHNVLPKKGAKLTDGVTEESYAVWFLTQNKEVQNYLLSEYARYSDDLDPGILDGNKYAQGITVENKMNPEGYKKFAEENLVKKTNLTPKEEEFVLDFIRPGGNVDWWNGFLRDKDASFDSRKDLADWFVGEGYSDRYPDGNILDHADFFFDNDPEWQRIFSGEEGEIGMGRIGYSRAIRHKAADYISEKLQKGFDGNYQLKTPTILHRGMNTGGNRVNMAGDFSWLKEGGAFKDNGFGFVSLSDEAVKAYAKGNGEAIILDYHLPAGQDLFYFGGIEKGANDGGAFILPQGIEGKIGKITTDADGTKHVPIYVGGTEEIKPEVRNDYKYLKMSIDAGGKDFEEGLERAYLAGDKKFAKSDLANEAAKNITDGKDAFYEGVTKTELKGRMRNKVKNADTDVMIDTMMTSIRKQVDDLIANIIDTSGVKNIAKVLAKDSNGVDELTRYLVLEELSKSENVKVALNSLKNDIHKEVLKKNFSLQEEKAIQDMAEDMLKEVIDTEFGDAVSSLKTINADLVDNKSIYDKVKALNDKITAAEKKAGDFNTDWVIFLDDQGRKAYAQVDPAFASLYKFHYKTTQGDATLLAKANAMFSKAFRYGTTSVNLASFGNQLFRDFGNAILVGGAWDTIKANADNLVDVFGQSIVNQIKMFDPEGYEEKQLELVAENVGESDLKKAAVSRELMRGSAIASSSTETSLYKNLRKKMKANDGQVKLKGMQSRLQNFVDKHSVEDLLNGKRENYLRKRVYASNLNDAMKQGYTLQQARVYAEFAMNNATTNFARQLYHMQAIADSTPYFSAAINGTKSFWRMWALDPVGISGRIMGGLILPTMALVGASLMDEENRKIYKNIPEYDKENSFVFVFNGQAVSIPIPQELSAVVAPFRQFVEYIHEANENDFGELMFNDLLGFSPVDLKGFSTIDMNKMISDPTIFDRFNRMFSRIFSQIAPVPVKTAYMLATGTDPYTGKNLRSRDYMYWNEETGSVETMSYNQNAFAALIANLWGDDMSADLMEKIVSGVIGVTGSNLLDDITTLFTEGAGNAAMSLGENVTEQLTKPITVNVYDRADSDWKAAVRQLTSEKEVILDSKKMKTLNEKLSQTKDPDERKKLLAERQDLVDAFQQKVGDTIKRLEQVYEGTFDRQKLAAAIQLLNFNSNSAYQAGSQYSSDLATGQFWEGRDAAVHTLEQMGVIGTSDMSIFGYLTTDKDGKPVVKYTSPIAIMDMDNQWTNQKDYHLANIKALASQNNLWERHEAVEDQINAIYAKNKLSDSDYDQIDAIYVNWNAEVMAALAPYVEAMTPEAAINNANVIDYLDSLIEVPGDYKKDRNGKWVTNAKLGNGSANAAYIKNYIKNIFKVNDTGYTSGKNYSDRKTYDKENKRWISK